MARVYCDRVVGMASGKIVFDGLPAALTNDAAQAIYGTPSDQAAEAGLAPASHQPLPVSALGHATA